MELKLIIAKGEPKGKVITVSKSPTVIGREAECDVVIASPKVSRKHCQVEVQGNRASLVDLGSGNGTLVNGKKIQKAELRAGDKVVVGPLGFVVEIDGRRAPAGAKPSAAPEPQTRDINDFLASLEKGEVPSEQSDEDVIQLSEEDLLSDDEKK